MIRSDTTVLYITLEQNSTTQTTTHTISDPKKTHNTQTSTNIYYVHFLRLGSPDNNLSSEESSTGLVEIDDLAVLAESLDKQSLANLGGVDELDLSSQLEKSKLISSENHSSAGLGNQSQTLENGLVLSVLELEPQTSRCHVFGGGFCEDGIRTVNVASLDAGKEPFSVETQGNLQVELVVGDGSEGSTHSRHILQMRAQVRGVQKRHVVLVMCAET